MTTVEVFVYGTLQRGGAYHAYLAGQRFVAEAATKPLYRLYQLDGYPGMVPAAPGTGGRSIQGEIWRVDAAGLARLDELEGVPEGLYARTEAALEPPYDHPGIFTYLYLRPVASREEIGGWHAAGGRPSDLG